MRAADTEIFVQERGPKDGQPVVFVHGTGAWSEAWHHSLEAAAGAGFRAIALDLPPFGFSTRPVSSDYSKKQQAHRIRATVRALGLRPPIYVGHSFGGGPVSEAAMADSSQAFALVLVDPALGIDPEGTRAPGDRRAAPIPLPLRAALAVEPVRNSLVAALLTNPAFTRRLLQAFVDDPARATPEWVAIYQRPLCIIGTTKAVGDWLPELVASQQVALSETAASWRRLQLPVVAIWGERDAITPLTQGRVLTDLVHGSRLIVIQGVGHIPQIEDTTRFNHVLLEVLESLRRKGNDARR